MRSVATLTSTSRSAGLDFVFSRIVRVTLNLSALSLLWMLLALQTRAVTGQSDSGIGRFCDFYPTLYWMREDDGPTHGCDAAYTAVSPITMPALHGDVCTRGYNPPNQHYSHHFFGLMDIFLSFSCGADGHVSATVPITQPIGPQGSAHCGCTAPTFFWNASDTCATGDPPYGGGYLHVHLVYTLPKPLRPPDMSLVGTTADSATFVYGHFSDLWTRAMTMEYIMAPETSFANSSSTGDVNTAALQLQQTTSSTSSSVVMRATLAGLEPDTTYNVRMCALNAQGAKTCNDVVQSVRTQSSGSQTTKTYRTALIAGASALVALGVVLCVVLLRVRKVRREREAYQALLVKSTAVQHQQDTVWEIAEADLVFGEDIAQGAFGNVLRATYLDHQVAVKRLKPELAELDEVTKDEFLREAQSMRLLRHRNVVFFYGAGVAADSGAPFLVTELMHCSLADIALDATQDCDWEQRLRYAQEAALGMEYLHSRQPPFVHRDLKTANLLVSETGCVKVADFGTSRYIGELWEKSAEEAALASADDTSYFVGVHGGSTRTRRQSTSIGTGPGALAEPLLPSENAGSVAWPASSAGHVQQLQDLGRGSSSDAPGCRTPSTAMSQVSSSALRAATLTGHIGTLLYCAPEVLQNLRYGLAVDVYSMAMVLYEIAERQRPYHDVNARMFELEDMIVAGRRPALTQLAPIKYVRLMEKCWSERPKARPTFHTIVQQLRVILNELQAVSLAP